MNPTLPLQGKHIILSITGGIAAYKSATLLRLLIKAGAEVQVIITPAGRQFITPVTLSALSGKPVICDFFTANTGEWHSHVDLGIWADAMIVAPATACTIAKMAHGVADNMAVTSYLSAKCPVFVAPAMDLDMMAHPSTKANIELLRSYGNHIIEPTEGELASHLVGKGRMEEPERIAQVLSDYFAESNALQGKKVLITAGPTIERIDPVRYISNFSTGKMGYALAHQAALMGAQVELVSGPVQLKPTHPAIHLTSVQTARQMLEACEQIWPTSQIGIMCAAVADYAPAKEHTHKIKREQQADYTLSLVRNPDIAATLGAEKQSGQLLVGFALETDHEQANATRKLHTKNLDMVVLNSLADSGAGFGTDTNRVTLYTPHAEPVKIPLGSKDNVAADILTHILTLLPQT